MVHSLVEQICSAVRVVTNSTGQSENFLPLHEPRLAGKEWEYLKDCLDSTFVSSVGKYVDRFENDVADYTGAGYAIAVSNGTVALHLALKLAGVSLGDEVIAPAMTFVATANAISYCNAVPHFVDCEEKTLGICPDTLRDYLKATTEIKNSQCLNKATGRVIRAIVPMHTFGHPCQLDKLLSVAHDFKLVMVEDAAEALGSTYCGKHTGTFGKLGTLSFNGNKIITTGGGGIILTDDKDFALRAKHLSTTAKLPHRWEYIHDEVGYNYRMPNLNAALGCAQLEQLPDFLRSKRDLFRSYQRAFTNVQQVELISEPENCSSNYWLQAILLSENQAEARDMVLNATNSAGFMTRPVWQLMHKLPPYKNSPRSSLPVSESLESRLINIPSSAYIN